MNDKTVPGQPKLPDFMARLREIYGGSVCSVSGAELISQQRDERESSLPGVTNRKFAQT
jgi:hypothetical protein